jgi:ribosomal protein L33
MAWQKTKILLVNTETDSTGKKVMHRYVVRKSKGKAKNVGQPTKLKLRKYNPVLRKHVEYSETKYK